MALVIKNSSFLVNHVLRVKDDHVLFLESALFGGRKKFLYHQIDRILLSSQYLLSFQVGAEVFSISANPGKRKHQDTIAAFVAKVRAAHGRTDEAAASLNWPAKRLT